MQMYASGVKRTITYPHDRNFKRQVTLRKKLEYVTSPISGWIWEVQFEDGSLASYHQTWLQLSHF
jgi:hypothetical protein